MPLSLVYLHLRKLLVLESRSRCADKQYPRAAPVREDLKTKAGTGTAIHYEILQWYVYLCARLE